MDDPFDPEDSDLESIPDTDTEDSDLMGDVTIPCPVTITDSTSSFLRDMIQGPPPSPLKKPPAYCPECGAVMHLCANCASGKVHTPQEFQGTGEP